MLRHYYGLCRVFDDITAIRVNRATEHPDSDDIAITLAGGNDRNELDLNNNSNEENTQCCAVLSTADSSGEFTASEETHTKENDFTKRFSEDTSTKRLRVISSTKSACKRLYTERKKSNQLNLAGMCSIKPKDSFLKVSKKKDPSVLSEFMMEKNISKCLQKNSSKADKIPVNSIPTEENPTKSLQLTISYETKNQEKKVQVELKSQTQRFIPVIFLIMFLCLLARFYFCLTLRKISRK